ncbi:DMT family transporter [Bacillus sp. V5-8f]|uniref:DMT family transporter n=1 Tax=Bacillus sp. V5-8f TaxID=2053044 RepID=UPI000C75B7BB|nr:DMT family transporter [Bacillus sp. V5-8f]PLT35987.1 EamA family transporter [Bacillus sp. V5-8f]
MKKHYVLTFLILANLFWAGNYVFGQYVVTELSPLQMTFLRWLIAFCLLFPIAHVIERPNWRMVWKQWKILIVMALLGIVGYNFLLYEALRFTTAMNASLVNSINPAIIVLFSSLLLKERISLINGIGLMVSLFGVLLVLTNGHLEQIFHLHFNRGDLLMLVAILVWTFYSIIGRTIKEVPPISATAASVLIGLLFLLPFISSSGFQFPESKKAILGMLYIGIFPSVGSFVFWNVAVRQIGPSRAGIFLNLIAVFTAILSLLLGKNITFVQILGGIFVFIGVYLTSQIKKAETTVHSEVKAANH